MDQTTSFPIGIFDSGIGGISVANALVKLLPREKLLYFGDTANLPYGTKPSDLIRAYSHSISQFLMNRSCKAIVVACNTASAAALNSLREQWPNYPFIGMEPAIKPAAAQTKSQKVGVLATEGTINSHRYADLMNRFAQDVRVLEDPCIGLVELIEQQKSDKIYLLLREVVEPMLNQGVDTIVLGCTHYPFIQKALQKIVGSDVSIINPAPAVARQVKRVLENKKLLAPRGEGPLHEFFFSGDDENTEALVRTLFEGHFQFNGGVLA